MHIDNGFSSDGKIGFLSLCTLTMGQMLMVRLDSMIMSSVLMVGVDFHSTYAFLMGLLSDGTTDSHFTGTLTMG